VYVCVCKCVCVCVCVYVCVCVCVYVLSVYVRSVYISILPSLWTCLTHKHTHIHTIMLISTLPFCSQIILSFMNYRRTVQDFGKCFYGESRVEYGFPYIGACSRGPSHMHKCPDPVLPVPCANGECTATFLDCLRSLRAQETEAFSLPLSTRYDQLTGSLDPAHPNQHTSLQEPSLRIFVRE
jgi:hypothetical protein